MIDTLTNLSLIILDTLATSAEKWLKLTGILKYSAWDFHDKLKFVCIFYLSILLIMISIHREVTLHLENPYPKYVYILAYPLVIVTVTLLGLTII